MGLQVLGMKSGIIAIAMFAGDPDSDRADSYRATAWLGHGADFSLAKSPAAALTVAEMVSVLKDNGFPVSAIAEVARVERKTIYSWLDGASTPRQPHEERMGVLFHLTKNASGGEFRHLYRVWKQKGDDGIALRDLLSAEDIDVAAIQRKLDHLRSSMEYYANLERKRSAPPSISGQNAVLDDLSVADFS